MKVLVTGGAGYIGSHTCVQLLCAGHSVIVLDDLSNSTISAVTRVEEIAELPIKLVIGSILDSKLLERLFYDHCFDAVIHFAGLKSISESLDEPVSYFQTNVAGSLSLLQAMKKASVKTLVFSSTAAIYGVPDHLPVNEVAPANPNNPYAESKLMVEKVLAALQASDPEWRVAILRYFNPVGAHPSGLIGEDPRNQPSNLLPVCLDVAEGLRDTLPIYGDDYPTPDGTGVRDFIHVMDLADGHLAALNYLRDQHDGCFETVNLGTGKGVSVRQMLAALEAASQVKLPTSVMPRRAGDVAACYADVSRARTVLRWEAQRSLDDMCRDAWAWRQLNPGGYTDE